MTGEDNPCEQRGNESGSINRRSALAAIFGVMVAISGLFAAFSAGLVWGLLWLAIIAAAIAAFAWWDMHQPPRA